MRVNVRLFARLRDLVGTGDLERTVPPGATIGSVWESLVAEWPPLDDYARVVRCARNADYARMTVPVTDGDEIAFLPPVSGG